MARELFSGAAEFQLFNAANELISTADCSDQVNPLVITATAAYTQLNNQCASTPQGYRHAGKQLNILVSIGDFTNGDWLALCSDSVKLTDINDPAQFLINVRHDTGRFVSSVKGIVIPYDGPSPTSDRRQWITANNLLLMNEQQTTMTFGVNDQRDFSVGFMALPDAAGVVYSMGNTNIAA